MTPSHPTHHHPHHPTTPPHHHRWCYPSAAPYTPEDTDSNCLWRSKGNIGSSLKLPSARNRPGGLLSGDPAQSPFADWNLLVLNYCDGGSFTG